MKTFKRLCSVSFVISLMAGCATKSPSGSDLLKQAKENLDAAESFKFHVEYEYGVNSEEGQSVKDNRSGEMKKIRM